MSNSNQLVVLSLLLLVPEGCECSWRQISKPMESLPTNTREVVQPETEHSHKHVHKRAELQRTRHQQSRHNNHDEHQHKRQNHDEFHDHDAFHDQDNPNKKQHNTHQRKHERKHKKTAILRIDDSSYLNETMLTEMLKMADTFTRAADYCSAVSTIDKPVYASSKNWQVNGCLITCSNNPECLGFNSGFTPKDPVCELLYVMITEMMPYDQSPRITNVTAGHPAVSPPSSTSSASSKAPHDRDYGCWIKETSSPTASPTLSPTYSPSASTTLSPTPYPAPLKGAFVYPFKLKFTWASGIQRRSPAEGLATSANEAYEMGYVVFPDDTLRNYWFYFDEPNKIYWDSERTMTENIWTSTEGSRVGMTSILGHWLEGTFTFSGYPSP
ncbi:hypothetical protein AAMO2058_001331500 [Amorphochlora amoebiformis]